MSFDWSYAQPFLDAAQLANLGREVEQQGVIVDPLLGASDERAVCGLNLTIAWPFPDRFKTTYEQLAARLDALGPGLYLYPFATTHITLLTLVDFKRHVSPGRDIQAAVTIAAGEALEVLNAVMSRQGPVEIDVGPPVLARSAAFFPVIERSGRLLALRGLLADTCRQRGGLLGAPFARAALHSTLLRFRIAPTDTAKFMAEFAAVARTGALGRATVDDVLVTLETKPYMQAGRGVGRVPL